MNGKIDSDVQEGILKEGYKFSLEASGEECTNFFLLEIQWNSLARSPEIHYHQPQYNIRQFYYAECESSLGLSGIYSDELEQKAQVIVDPVVAVLHDSDFFTFGPLQRLHAHNMVLDVNVSVALEDLFLFSIECT